MFYNARWYDPYRNHMTQPDSIVPDSYNPLDWNRYSYVRYNPLKYTDPTGHDPACGPDGIWCGTDGSGYAGGTGSKGGGRREERNGGSLTDDDLCKKIGGCDEKTSLYDLLPITGTQICGFILQNPSVCNADYSGLFDPYNPYSIQVLLSYIPIFVWNPYSIDWGAVSIDVIGIAADLYSPAQPYATRVEIAGATLNSIDLTISTIEVDYYLHGKLPSADWIDFTLDILAVPPEIGIYASLVGLSYNLTKGFDVFYSQRLYGPPQPYK